MASDATNKRCRVVSDANRDDRLEPRETGGHHQDRACPRDWARWYPGERHVSDRRYPDPSGSEGSGAVQTGGTAERHSDLFTGDRIAREIAPAAAYEPRRGNSPR